MIRSVLRRSGADSDKGLAARIRNAAHVIGEDPADFDPLLELIGDARVVLLGEASHGTHEFYRARAVISRRLIEEKGFSGVAVEADWPDAYRVNRYVRGIGLDQDATEALGGFLRFPQWMWRNADVLDFVGWMRDWNDRQPPERRAGFYGIDLYSLFSSIEVVLEYLDRVDPDAARRARYRYACFDHFGDDTQAYGYAAAFGMTESCESAVIDQLQELRRNAAEYARRDGQLARDEMFQIEQNARLVTNAERYYRSMFRGQVLSWNLRDQHMTETLAALMSYLDRPGTPAKLVVWAHNSHLGDARATEMGERGELNVGQLVRERFGRESINVGFTTYTGTVTAASEWDGPAERKRVIPSLPESWEWLLNETGIDSFLLPLRGNDEISAILSETRLERAIGVIYLPRTERVSHYFGARLSDQFDAVIHYGTTRAVEPLERAPIEHTREAPETYPTAL